MASAVMNGRLRSIPGGSTPSSLSTQQAQGEPAVSVSALPISLTGNISLCHITRKENVTSHTGSRGCDGTAAPDVPLHRRDEDGVAPHTGVVEGVPLIGIAREGERIVDHCWWDIGSFSCGSHSEKQNGSDSGCTSNNNKCRSTSTLILAVLSRCQNSTPTLNHASSCFSVVRLYHCKDKDRTTTARSQVHLASIQTSYHAISIAMGGNELDGLLVTARSSGMELHSLKPMLDRYMEGHCLRCGDPLKDSALEEGSSEIEKPETTPSRRSNTMPATPIAPKSLSRVFEDASQSISGQEDAIKSPSRTHPEPIKSQNPPTVQGRKPPEIYHESKPVELLQSYCIHAMHLSYPYLSVASGDRLGVWNVDCDSLFMEANGKPNENGSSSNTPKHAHEALWATTLSMTKSVHRRVTSMHMTRSGEVVALSCWDGSAFVYLASSSAKVGCDDSGQSSLITSWERVGESCKPPWEQPSVQNSADGLFPTFVALRRNTLLAWSQPESLLMAVSTPSSDKIRCFDVFAGMQCPDMFAGENPSGGEVHGLATAFSSEPNVIDELLWITERDLIQNKKWPSFGRTKEVERELSLVAESSSANGSKAFLCKVYSETKLPQTPHHPSLWAVQIQWDAEEASTGRRKFNEVKAPFLVESDIADLVDRETGFSQKSHAVIDDDFFVIAVPSYAMMYVYARKYVAWKAIDMQDELDITEDMDTFAGIKTFVLDSHCFVLLSDESTLSIHVRVWDLHSLFLDQGTPHFQCSITAKCCMPSRVEVRLIDENVDSFAVVGHGPKGNNGLCIWEIQRGLNHFSCSDCFLPLLPLFDAPLEHLKVLSAFSLSRMKDIFPNDFTELIDTRQECLAMHFQIQSSDWLCIPRANLWHPIQHDLHT